MHTQNINIKTATKKSAERWGENRLAAVIAEQESLLAALCDLRNSPSESRDEEILSLLYAMSQNVLTEGVTDWHRAKPLVSLSVIQPWLQAKAHAVRLYGETGKAAWEYSQKSLRNDMLADIAMRDADI